MTTPSRYSRTARSPAGDKNDFGQCDVPSGVGTPANPVVSVAAGSFHTVVVLSDGSIRCWGHNSSGQCTPPAGLRVRLPE